MEARPIVDLPAPDSPIRPRISPRFSAMSTLSTSTRPVMVSTRSFSSTRMLSSPADLPLALLLPVLARPALSLMALLMAPSHFSLCARRTGIDRQKPVDNEVDADRQQGDRRGRIERCVDAEIDRRRVVAHHAAPVGIGWLHAETQEAEGGD